MIPSEGKVLVLSLSYQSPLRLGVGIGIAFRVVEWFFRVVPLVFILTPLGRRRCPPFTRMSDIGALVNEEYLVISRKRLRCLSFLERDVGGQSEELPEMCLLIHSHIVMIHHLRQTLLVRPQLRGSIFRLGHCLAISEVRHQGVGQRRRLIA